tara:strand:- start:2320 stop:3243 length:924 start_codon:yes stop_codon:yes gene_type:complete
MNQRSAFIFLMRTFIILLSIFILYSILDFNKLKIIFLNINYWPLIFAILIYLLVQLVSAQRFIYVSESLGYSIPFYNSVRVHFIGLWFNNIMPTGLGGDIIKAGMFKKSMGLSAAITASLLDRGFGMIFAIICIFLQLPLYYFFFGNTFTLIVLLICISTFTVIALGILWAKTDLNKKLTLFKWFHMLFNNLNKSFNRNFLFKQFWVCFIIHFNGILAYFLIGLSLGISVEVINYILVVPLIFLTALFPLSYAGWGLRELSAVALFSLIGVSNELAFTSAVFFGLLSIIIGIPGIIFLFFDKKKNSH